MFSYLSISIVPADGRIGTTYISTGAHGPVMEELFLNQCNELGVNYEKVSCHSRSVL